jgi:hypothetical protein
VDKIISARLDESIVSHIGFLALRLRKSKKKVIEEAIQIYSQHIKIEEESDVFDQTFGAWQSAKSDLRTIEAIRAAFKKSMKRKLK